MLTDNTLSNIIKYLPSPSIIILANTPNFTIIEASKTYIKVFGLSESELIGSNASSYITHVYDDKNFALQLQDSLLTVVNTGESHHMDVIEHGMSESSKKYWEAENTPVFDDNHTVAYIIHTLTDVTDKVLAAHSKKYAYTSLLDHSTSPIFIVNPDGSILDANKAVCDLFGYSEDEFKSLSWTTIADFRENIQHKSAPNDNDHTRGQLTGLKKNGGKFPFEFFTSTCIDALGEKFKTFTINDISEIKKIERDMALLINNTEESFILLNKDLCIVSYNKQFFTLYHKYFGLTIKKGDSIINYAQPERKENLRILYTKVLTGHTEESEIKVPYNGDLKIFTLKYNPARDEYGAIIGVFVTALDVTEQRKQEEHSLKLMQENLAAGALFQNVLESISDGFVALDKNWNYTYVNEKGASLLNNHTPEQLIGKHIWTLFPEGIDQPFYKSYQKVMEERVSITLLDHYIPWDKYFENRIYPSADGGITIFYTDVTEQIKAVEQVRQTQKILEKILDSSLDVICTVDEKGNFVEVSAASENVWGYKPSELKGKPYMDFVYVDDHESTVKVAQEIMDGIDKTNFENRYVRKDGTLVSIMWSAHWDSSEKTMYCIARDITERIDAERKLRLSEKQYKNLFENNPCPMFIWDFGTLQIIECNEEALLKYGYTREEFLQLNIRDIRPEEDIPLIDEVTQSEENYGRIHNRVWTHKKKNGELMQVEISGHLMEYHGKKVSLVLLNDITEKLDTQKALLISNERFNYVTKATFDAIWDWDLNTDLIYWGDGFQLLFGHNATDLTSDIHSWSSHIHSQDLERVIDSLQKLVRGTETNWQDEYQYLKADGSYAYVIDRGFVIRNEKGKAIRMVGAMQDITQRKKEERQLKLLNSVVTNTADSVLITEAEPIDEPGPKIVYVNDAFTRMTGYSAEEVIGKSPRILQGPKTDKEELARLKTAMKGWEPCEVTTINYKKSGEEFWINFSLSPVADEKGWFTHWIAIERDVTQRKNEEHQKVLLAEISQLFNLTSGLGETLEKVLQKISDTGNYIFAEAWLIDSSNTKMNLCAKYSKNTNINLFYTQNAELKNLKIGEGLPGKVWESQAVIYWNADESNEYFLRAKDAQKAGLKKVNGLPLFYNNAVIGVLLLGNDDENASQHKLVTLSDNFGTYLGSEIKRKQLEQELGQIFNAAPDIICIASMDGYFKKINPAACEMLEYSEQELLAEPIVTFIHPDDREFAFSGVQALKDGQPTYYCENRIINKSGHTKWLAWTYSLSIETELIYALAKDITEKKNLEELLEKANRLARIGSWEADLTKGSLYWSSITKEIHEADKDYVPDLARAINLYREGESRERITHKVKDCIEKGIPWDEELQIVTLKGKLKWIRTIGNAELKDGLCVRFYGSFQDIDERKKAELEALKAYQEKNTILESIGDGFFAVDHNWTVTYWNYQAEKILGTPSHRVVNKNLWDLYTDAVGSESYINYHKALAENSIVHFETYYDALQMWLEVSAYPSASGLSVYFKNITERKKAEEDLKDSEERRRLIMSSALDAIICIDHHGNVIFWNPQAESIFGWNESEVMGEKLSGFIIPETYRVRHDNGLDHYLKTGEAYALNVLLELSAIRRNGEEFPVELTVIPISQNNGVFFCAFIRDITERKKAEKRLKKLNENLVQQTKELAISNAELEQFAHVASHDLQEPLRMVTSFLTQIEKNYGELIDEKGKKYIHYAVDGAKRMRQIILDLLDFSRVGRTEDKQEPIDLNEVIEDIKLLYRKKIDEKKASIKTSRLPIINAAKSPIYQLFQNLLDNALKYQKKETTPIINISSQENEKEWQFEISDNGIGIDAEYFDKIFIIFQRLHNKEEYSGTGMGLAITKKIVENLGGKIWVTSEDGKGSTFSFTIKKV